FRCQCPLVTPAALTGNGCADASAGTSMEITQDARSSFFTSILRPISSSKSPAPDSRLRSPGTERSCRSRKPDAGSLKPEARSRDQMPDVDFRPARTTSGWRQLNEVSVPDFRRRKESCDDAEESA